GGQSLVLWQDDRGTFVGWDDIYSARVSPDGAGLDPAGIVVATAPYGQTSVAAAFDGANYFAAWQDGRAGLRGPDLYGGGGAPTGAGAPPPGLARSGPPPGA